MPERPSIQFYTKDWRSNLKLRRATLADRGLMLELMCLMNESEEHGILRMDLDEIASLVPCRLREIQSLIDRTILKGAPAGQMSPPVIDKIGSRNETLVLAPQPGPIWFSSRMVVDEFNRRQAVINGRKGGNPDLKPASYPPPSGEGLTTKVNPPLKKKRKMKNSGNGEGVGGEVGHAPTEISNSTPQSAPKSRAKEWLANKGIQHATT